MKPDQFEHKTVFGLQDYTERQKRETSAVHRGHTQLCLRKRLKKTNYVCNEVNKEPITFTEGGLDGQEN